MKPLSEQDHYEILEITRDADAEAIERAHKSKPGLRSLELLSRPTSIIKGNCATQDNALF